MTRVLIVDDEVVTLEASRLLLSSAGFDVEVAASGAKAIEIGKEYLPEILVVDLLLEDGVDGIQVSESLESLNPKMQTIVLTGYVAVDLRARIEKHPAMKCLIKPIRYEDLVAAVEEAICRQVDAVKTQRENTAPTTPKLER